MLYRTGTATAATATTSTTPFHEIRHWLHVFEFLVFKLESHYPFECFQSCYDGCNHTCPDIYNRRDLQWLFGRQFTFVNTTISSTYIIKYDCSCPAIVTEGIGASTTLQSRLGFTCTIPLTSSISLTASPVISIAGGTSTGASSSGSRSGYGDGGMLILVGGIVVFTVFLDSLISISKFFIT